MVALSEDSSSEEEVDFVSTSCRQSLEPVQQLADSEDEDLMAISRQLRDQHETCDGEVVPTFCPAPKVTEAPTNSGDGVALMRQQLSKWRQKLRVGSIHCVNQVNLNDFAQLEASLNARWQPSQPELILTWVSEALSRATEPCTCALVLLNSCCRAPAAKKTKEVPGVNVVLDGIASWLKAAEPDERRRFYDARTPAHRRFAFFLGQRERLVVLRRVVELFRLNDDLAEQTMKALMDELVQEGIYKEACQFIGVLGLQEHYDPAELLLPCLAEGRIKVVEDFIEDSEMAQRKFLAYLDERYDRLSLLFEDLAKCRMEGVTVQNGLLTSTALKKLILRLLKKFDLPLSVVPRVGALQGTHEVVHLLYERYVRKIKRSDWTTAVEKTVGDSRECAIALVERLLDYRVPGAAQRWARKFRVTAEDVPGLQRFEDEEVEAEEEEEEEEEGDQWERGAGAQESADFLPFPLHPREDIELVSVEDDLWRAIQQASKADKLGFDAEWTSLYKQTGTSISILQMALRDVVFIIDMQTLCPAIGDPEVWEFFRTEVFENDKVLKIFFSAHQDLQMVWASVPEMQSPQAGEDSPAHSYRGLVDLEQLMTHCLKAEPTFFPSLTDGGLSGLVESCLGKPLRKMSRLSNWRARPLSANQKVYAALDAHCLISVHDWLEQRQAELGLGTELDLRAPAELENRKKKRKKAEEAKPASS